MTISFLSKICEKPIAKNHEAVECDNCKLWVHIKYNKMNKKTCNLFMEDDTARYCIKCTKSIFPFNDIDNNELHSTIQGKKNKNYNIFKKYKFKRTHSNWTLNRKKNLITLQFVITIKNSMKAFTKTLTRAQIFYMWALTPFLTILMTFKHYYHNYL